MNDRALEDPVEEDVDEVKFNFIQTTEPVHIPFIDPEIEMPEPNTDLLLQIHLKGECAGYYDDVFIIMTGGYRPKNKQWYYYDITGRYDLNSNDGEVIGWRYLEQ